MRFIAGSATRLGWRRRRPRISILKSEGCYPKRSEGVAKGLDSSVAEPVLSGEILRFAQNDKGGEGLRMAINK